MSIYLLVSKVWRLSVKLSILVVWVFVEVCLSFLVYLSIYLVFVWFLSASLSSHAKKNRTKKLMSPPHFFSFCVFAFSLLSFSQEEEEEERRRKRRERFRCFCTALPFLHYPFSFRYGAQNFFRCSLRSCEEKRWHNCNPWLFVINFFVPWSICLYSCLLLLQIVLSLSILALSVSWTVFVEAKRSRDRVKKLLQIIYHNLSVSNFLSSFMFLSFRSLGVLNDQTVRPFLRRVWR